MPEIVCTHPVTIQRWSIARSGCYRTPIGPEPPDILPWVRTASSGRRLIVTICGGSYGFLPASFISDTTPIVQHPTVLSTPGYYFECCYEIGTGPLASLSSPSAGLDSGLHGEVSYPDLHVSLLLGGAFLLAVSSKEPCRIRTTQP